MLTELTGQCIDDLSNTGWLGGRNGLTCHHESSEKPGWALTMICEVMASGIPEGHDCDGEGRFKRYKEIRCFFVGFSPTNFRTIARSISCTHWISFNGQIL